MARSQKLLRGAMALALVVVLGIVASLRGAARVESGLHRHLTNAEGQRLRFASIWVNPLTRKVTLHNLSVESAGGQALLTIDNAHAKLGGGLFFGGELVVRELVVEGFAVNVWLNGTGAGRWQPRLVAPDSDANGLRIERLQMNEGTLRLWTSTVDDVANPTSATPYVTALLADISGTLDNVHSREARMSDASFRARLVGAGGRTDASPAGNATSLPHEPAMPLDKDRNPGDTTPRARGQIDGTGQYDLHARRGAWQLTFTDAPLQPVIAVMTRSRQAHLPGGALSGTGTLTLDGMDAHYEGALSVRDLGIRSADGSVWLRAGEARSDAVVAGNQPGHVAATHLELNEPRFAVTVGSANADELTRWLAPFTGTGLQRSASWFTTQSLSVADGDINIIDARWAEPAVWRLRDVAGVVGRAGERSAGSAPAQSDTPLFVNLQARLGDAGSLSVDAHQNTDAGGLDGRGQWTLEGVAANRLTPYVAQLAGRALASGSVDLVSQYRAHDGQIALANELVLNNLELGGELPGDEAMAPADLALARALLTDEARRLRLAFEAAGEAPLGVLLRASLRSRLGDLATHSGRELARLVVAAATETGSAPVTDEWTLTPTTVPFEAGDAALNDAAQRQLAVIARVLDRRPLLGLRALAQATGREDRAALARRQLRLHVTLATSARPPLAGAAAPLDFADPKVHAVLDEFAAARLPADVRSKLQARQASLPADGAATHYASVYEALAAVEIVSGRALSQLARYRTLAVFSELSRLGVAPERLVAAQASDGEAAPGRRVVELEPIATSRPSSKSVYSHAPALKSAAAKLLGANYESGGTPLK